MVCYRRLQEDTQFTCIKFLLHDHLQNNLLLWLFMGDYRRLYNICVCAHCQKHLRLEQNEKTGENALVYPAKKNT